MTGKQKECSRFRQTRTYERGKQKEGVTKKGKEREREQGNRKTLTYSHTQSSQKVLPMTEVIFQGQKQYPNISPLTGNFNCDISFVQHTTEKQDKQQYIEIICRNTETKTEANRLYVSYKIISDIINKEEEEKNTAAKNEFTPLSPASMKSVLIQKLLDLLSVNTDPGNVPGKGPVKATAKDGNVPGNEEHSFSIELLLINGVQMCLQGAPEGMTAFQLAAR